MSRARRWLTAAACGTAIALLVGGWPGVMVGLVTALMAARLLSRVESPQVRRERAIARSDLPFAADLLAASLHTGAPPDRVVLVVGEVVAGPVGARLVLVGRALRLGATPDDAWSHMADLPGGERLARAAARSADHGSGLTGACGKQAAELRLAKAAAAEAAARKVGVLSVLPLSACYLPALLLIGVVPVVVMFIRDVLNVL